MLFPDLLRAADAEPEDSVLVLREDQLVRLPLFQEGQRGYKLHSEAQALAIQVIGNRSIFGISPIARSGNHPVQARDRNAGVSGHEHRDLPECVLLIADQLRLQCLLVGDFGK